MSSLGTPFRHHYQQPVCGSYTSNVGRGSGGGGPAVGAAADSVDSAVEASGRRKPTASSGHWRDCIPGVDLWVVRLGGAEVRLTIRTTQGVNPAVETGGSGEGKACCSHARDAVPCSGR